MIRVRLELCDRESRNADDVDALLDDFRKRLLAQLDEAEPVRLRLT